MIREFFDRHQLTCIIKVCSRVANLTFEVPHISVLGSLLFLIYFNESDNVVFRGMCNIC
jgi:hypothetical protein